MSLSERIRANSEAAPWVVGKVKEMEAEIERLKELLAEAADDLTDLIATQYPPEGKRHPRGQFHYENDMVLVYKIRAALAGEEVDHE